MAFYYTKEAAELTGVSEDDRIALKQAIDHAAKPKLCRALWTLCKQNPGAARIASSILKVELPSMRQPPSTPSETSSSSSEEELASSSSNASSSSDESKSKNESATETAPNVSTARKRKREVTCARCEKSFELTKKSEEEQGCYVHTGSCRMDNTVNAWTDTYSDDYYPPPEEFPKGYIWSCCRGDGESIGCSLAGSHVVGGF